MMWYIVVGILVGALMAEVETRLQERGGRSILASMVVVTMSIVLWPTIVLMIVVSLCGYNWTERRWRP